MLLVNLLTDMLPAMTIALRSPALHSPEQLLHEGPEASLGGALRESDRPAGGDDGRRGSRRVAARPADGNLAACQHGARLRRWWAPSSGKPLSSGAPARLC